MLNKRTWYEEVEELHAIAASEDEIFDASEGEDSFISLSAADSTKQLAALRPVALDEDRESEYLKFFFPESKSALLGLFEDLADVTNRINAFFSFMRRLVNNGRKIYALENDPAALSEYVNKILSEVISADVDGSNAADDTFSYLKAFMDGSFHNIIPSDVYKGGVDASLSGGVSDVGRPPSYLFGVRITSSSDVAKHAYSTDTERMEVWSTPTCLNVLKAAREIVEFLFASSTVSAKLRRRVLPITTKFDEIENIFTRHTGITLNQKVLSNITFTRASIDQFVSLEFLRFPSREAQEAANVGAAPIDGLSGEALANQRLNDKSRVVPEAELLNGKIRSTVRFTFEEDIARFVSQSPEDRKVSLYAVNNWFTIWSRQFIRTKKSRIAGSLTMADIPRYVLPMATLPNVTKARKQDGLVTEPTRANDDGLFITPNGTIEFRPDSTVRDTIELASKYEALCDELYELAANSHVNVQQFALSPVAHLWTQIPLDEFTRMADLVREIGSYSGTVLSWDWDYGTVCIATDIPGIVRTGIEIGSKKPDDLALADYLGMNLAADGAKPVQKDFASAMYLMTTHINTIADVEAYSGSKFGSESDPRAFARNDESPLVDVLTFYFQNVFVDKKFMSLQELCAQAMRNLDYGTELPREGRDRVSLYSYQTTTDGAPKPQFTVNHLTSIAFVRAVLDSVLMETAGGVGSHIYSDIHEEYGRNISARDFKEYQKDHPDFFSPAVSPMHDFGKVYSYFGGQILKLIFDQINSLTPQELTTFKQGRQSYEVNGRKTEIKRLTNLDVFRKVKPITTMLGKYVANKENLFARAKAQMEAIERNPNFSADGLKVPGLQQERSVFPHQLDTQSYLRKKEPPPFAVLAISPGGGKTGIGTMDISALAGELLELGVRVKPLVIAPDNLIKTWCDDIKYFLGDSWNAVPISTAVMNRWGAERLQELLDNAPANTIFITGMAFMSNARQNVVVGTSTVRISGHQEFIKRLAPNYVIIDESHKLKTSTSQRHKIVKAVTTATFVKYLRIASGTLMPNTPKDLEAQVALYSPHIFRTGELSELKNEDAEKESLKLGNSAIPTWQAGTPSRARAKLGRYAAVVYKKRKEWAWMLPSPIESFHAISLIDTNASDEERRDQELHEELYDAVLKLTEESIKKLFDAAEKANKKRRASGDEDDDEPMDESEGGNSRIDDMEDGLPKGIDVNAFKQYLARFERLIIAPEFDPLYPNIFGEGKRYTSRKARYIANLAAKHFHPEPWSPNGTIKAVDKDGRLTSRGYHEYDLVRYKGDWYLARKFDTTTDRFVPLPDETIGITPDKNPTVWKKEPEGKLIIITRYNNSATAIRDALPPELQRQTALFTGDEENKWKGFEQFKTDPRIKILIANEQGMSEGHNLQMASRIIRAESPWGPGELDQTSARIFRPDPKGAAEGELYRDVVYLDWVLADNTMEVAKQARVISKVFATTRIDESENPLYTEVFKRHNVPTHEEMPELNMGVEALKSRSSLMHEPYNSMRTAYSALNGVIRREFHDMRENGEAGMIPVEAQAPLPGSSKINAPFVANQDIPDPHNWKPVSIERIISGNDDVRADPEGKLIGRPVVTDFGTGKIVSVRLRKGSPDNPVSSVKVKLKNPPPGVDEVVTINVLGVVYGLLNPISTADMHEHFDVSLAYTQKDLREEQKKEQQLKEQEEQEERERKNQRKREEAEARDRVRSKEAGDKRKRNIKEGKPINQGVRFDENADKKIRTGVKAVVAGDNKVRVHPSYFHGYLTLEGEFDGPNVNLKKLGFKNSGEYVFVTIQRYSQLAAVFDYLEENFELSKATEDRLNDVQEAFAPGKRGLYKLELAASVTLPMFFATRKKIVTNRKEIRVYPIFMSDTLMLAVDIATSPAIRTHIGQSIPGANAKWQLSEGHWHYFAEGKMDIRNKITEIKKNGYVVTNEKDAIKELAEINFRKARNSDK